ncbi:hypothetical protein FRX31_033954 [Thalictrum thalictroides]|uniref:Transmembrane protein n=1 Tax=Thalictrum thalictroides TaxID=46969 RepID=A0A7J6UW93_THATH|nr:hypothetical protein FRX31_033954 [Thalictrum thalictroides]
MEISSPPPLPSSSFKHPISTEAKEHKALVKKKNFSLDLNLKRFNIEITLFPPTLSHRLYNPPRSQFSLLDLNFLFSILFSPICFFNLWISGLGIGVSVLANRF